MLPDAWGCIWNVIGPIDLIIEAFGPLREINAAYDAATTRFVTVLDELCGELTLLRRSSRRPRPSGRKEQWRGE